MSRREKRLLIAAAVAIWLIIGATGCARIKLGPHIELGKPQFARQAVYQSDPKQAAAKSDLPVIVGAVETVGKYGLAAANPWAGALLLGELVIGDVFAGLRHKGVDLTAQETPAPFGAAIINIRAKDGTVWEAIIPVMEDGKQLQLPKALAPEEKKE